MLTSFLIFMPFVPGSLLCVGGYLHWLCAPCPRGLMGPSGRAPLLHSKGFPMGVPCKRSAPALVLLFSPPAGNSEAGLLGNKSPQVMAGRGLRMSGTAMPAWHLSLPHWWPPPGRSGGSVGALAGWGVGVSWEWGV